MLKETKLHLIQTHLLKTEKRLKLKKKPKMTVCTLNKPKKQTAEAAFVRVAVSSTTVIWIAVIRRKWKRRSEKASTQSGGRRFLQLMATLILKICNQLIGILCASNPLHQQTLKSAGE